MFYFFLIAFLATISQASDHQPIVSLAVLNPINIVPVNLFNSLLDCQHVLGHPTLKAHHPSIIANLLERDRIDYLNPTPLPLPIPRANEEILASIGRSITPELISSCHDDYLLAYLTSHLIQYFSEETISSLTGNVVDNIISSVSEMPCTSFAFFPPNWFVTPSSTNEEDGFDGDHTGMIESLTENSLWSFAFLPENSFRVIFSVGDSNCHLISASSLKYFSRHQLSLISPYCIKDLSNLSSVDLSMVIPFLSDDAFSLYKGDLSPPSIKALSKAQINHLSENPGKLSLEYFSPCQMSTIPSSLLTSYLCNSQKLRKLSSLWRNVPLNVFDEFDPSDSDFQIYPSDYQFIPRKLLVFLLTNDSYLSIAPSEDMELDLEYQDNLPITGEQFSLIAKNRPDIGGSLLAFIDSRIDDNLLSTINLSIIEKLTMGIRVKGLKIEELFGISCISLLKERSNFYQVVQKMSSSIPLNERHACYSINSIDEYSSMSWLRSVGGGSPLCRKIILETSERLTQEYLKKNLPELIEGSFLAPVKYWSENMSSGLMAYVSVFHLESFRAWITVANLNKWLREDSLILTWISPAMVRDRHIHFTNDMVPHLSSLAFSLFNLEDWEKYASETNGYGIFSMVIQKDPRLKLHHLLPSQLRMLGSLSMGEINIWSLFPLRYIWRLSVEQRSSLQDWQLSLTPNLLPSISIWNINRLLISRPLFDEWILFWRDFSDLSSIVPLASNVVFNQMNKNIREKLLFLLKNSLYETGLSHQLNGRFVRSVDISYLLTSCLGFNLKETEVEIINLFLDSHHGWFDLQIDCVERLISLFKKLGFNKIFCTQNKSIIKNDQVIFAGYWQLGDKYIIEEEVVMISAATTAAASSVDPEKEDTMLLEMFP